MRTQLDLSTKPRAQRALQLAHEHHMGIERKYCGEPYITHPIRVAERIVEFALGYDENVIIAALLHDCAEDENQHGQKMPLHVIEQEFGTKAARYVGLLTKQKRGNRAETNAAYTKQLLTAPVEVQAIKLADILDNITGLADADSKFAPVYLAEKKEQALAMRTTGPTAAHAAANKLKGMVLDQISRESNRVAEHVLHMMRAQEAERLEDERLIEALIAEEHDRIFADVALF